MQRTAPFNLTHVLLWLFLVLVALFLARQFGELKAVADTLRGGNLGWIAVAAALQGIYYLILTDISVVAFQIVGIRRTVRQLLPLVLGSLIINVLAPTGGIAGAGLFVHDASVRRQSAVKAGSGALLSVLVSYSSFVPILAAALVLLAHVHEVRAFELAGTVALLALIALMALVFRFATRRHDFLRQLLSGIDRLAAAIARLLRRQPFLRTGWTDELMLELAEAGSAIRAKPLLMGWALTLGVLGYVANLLSFAALLLAFQIPPLMTWIVAGYAISLLFWIVAPAPQGVGIEEAIMGGILVSIGLPPAQAIVLALAFRGVHFWLPLLAGIGLFVRHQHRLSTTRP